MRAEDFRRLLGEAQEADPAREDQPWNVVEAIRLRQHERLVSAYGQHSAPADAAWRDFVRDKRLRGSEPPEPEVSALLAAYMQESDAQERRDIVRVYRERTAGDVA